ncbi:MAG TPA: hypothetical protein ENK77_02555 [Epsilonproteobacteria bacterium]|jgi:hypothetical protein|nr:hypothetical protein [Campylobacteraceae bacterium]HHH37479.1 hypothetical protein [Campylobacterota bacterium]
MQTELKEKLEKVVELVNNDMVDPDIDIEYCIPEVATTTDSCDVTGDPYIIVKYNQDKYVERKIRLSKKHLEKEPQDLANLVTFFIEQFIEEVDSLNYGAQ